MIQGIYVDAISEDELFKRLESLIKKNGKIQISEEKKKKVGFTSEENEEESCLEEMCESEPRVGVQIRGFGV